MVIGYFKRIRIKNGSYIKGAAMNNILLLASQSASRRLLLEQAKIPFELIAQHADEAQCDWNRSLREVVNAIARYKMDHALIPPAPHDDAVCFVLTADTLCQTAQGTLMGKPVDHADAVAKIKLSNTGICRAGTAFCLDRKIYRDGAWHRDDRIQQYVEARYEFHVPDHWIERYLAHSWAGNASGAIAVELYGAQFLKMIDGSYTALLGLPLFELRQALENLGFYRIEG
jgi:septum formation protein